MATAADSAITMATMSPTNRTVSRVSARRWKASVANSGANAGKRYRTEVEVVVGEHGEDAGRASAAEFDPRDGAWAIGDRTKATWIRPSTSMSAVYLA